MRPTFEIGCLLDLMDHALDGISIRVFGLVMVILNSCCGCDRSMILDIAENRGQM